MAHIEESRTITVLPPDTKKIGQLWRVAGILALVTGLEFLVAFGVPHQYHTLRVWVFVGMTIVKAAFIVGEFMHLRYEAKVLIWSIVIPMVFVIWMLVAFVYEGMAIADIRHFF